jgi:hypothetical protein
VKEIYICLPVHNEEKNLEKCLISINRAIKFVNNKIKTFICLNDCFDKSKQISLRCKNKYLPLNIKILESKRGKLNAQEEILKHIPSNRIIFFIDSDTEIAENSIKIILKEFKKHKSLLAIGGFPVAKRYLGLNPWKKFLDLTLNIRSRHPMSEISKQSVSAHHKLAIKDPQLINTNQSHELKSKIFFHGRLFALRSKKYWNKPADEKQVVGDDSYLPDYLIYNYGKNRIRIRYDAVVYFNPVISIKKHYKAYKRIYFDLKNLRENFPEFKEIRKNSELRLDKDYIKIQDLKTRFYFLVYRLIRIMERLLFKMSFKRNPASIWVNQK